MAVNHDEHPYDQHEQVVEDIDEGNPADQSAGHHEEDPEEQGLYGVEPYQLVLLFYDEKEYTAEKREKIGQQTGDSLRDIRRFLVVIHDYLPCTDYSPVDWKTIDKI